MKKSGGEKKTHKEQNMKDRGSQKALGEARLRGKGVTRMRMKKKRGRKASASVRARATIALCSGQAKIFAKQNRTKRRARGVAVYF